MITDLMKRLESNDNVRSNDCGNGLTSYNFTAKAFRDGLWDATNVRARGLFLDGEGNIAGRGYDKYFNINQNPGFTRDEVLERFVGPITVSEKRNGYLAIVFEHDGQIKVFTKGGPGDYSDEGRRIVLNGVDEDALWLFLRDNGVSMTFEIISDDDYHIIDEGEERAILLDVIVNVEEFTPWDKTKTDAVADQFGFESANWWTIDASELGDQLDHAALAKNEGVVIKDTEGRMTKVKSDLYLRVKALRGGLTRLMLGRDVRRHTEDIDRLIDAGIKDHIEDYAVLGVTGDLDVDLPRLVKDWLPDWLED